MSAPTYATGEALSSYCIPEVVDSALATFRDKHVNPMHKQPGDGETASLASPELKSHSDRQLPSFEQVLEAARSSDWMQLNDEEVTRRLDAIDCGNSPPDPLTIASAYTLSARQFVALRILCLAVLEKVAFRQLGLNMIQQESYNNAADALRQCLLVQSEGPDRPPQLFMCLTGAAGTGKSRVLHALDAYVTRLGSDASDLVQYCASTGQAASLLQSGCTAYMFLKMYPGKAGILQYRKATDGIRALFSGVGLVLVDELSMVSAAFLAVMSSINVQPYCYIQDCQSCSIATSIFILVWATVAQELFARSFCAILVLTGPQSTAGHLFQLSLLQMFGVFRFKYYLDQSQRPTPWPAERFVPLL